MKLFGEVFCSRSDNAFCYTATTHGITHLYDNLISCGPLMNVSQYIIERLIGQPGSKVKSRSLPETQMLNSYHMQFSLQLMQGGVSYRDEPSIGEPMDEGEGAAENEEMENSMTVVRPAGKSRVVEKSRKRLWGQVVRWAVEEENLDANAVEAIETVPRAKMKRDRSTFVVESKASFDLRKQQRNDARQRYYVAAHFPRESCEAEGEIDVWYGCVRELLSVEIRVSPAQVEVRTVAIV